MLRHGWVFTLALAAVAAGGARGWAQADPTRDLLPAIRVFTGKDGLPENAVMGLAVSEGRLWVATQDGAAAFEGRAWRTENLPDKARSNFLRDLATTPEGVLWFARQDGGVARFQNGVWTSFADQFPPPPKW